MTTQRHFSFRGITLKNCSEKQTPLNAEGPHGDASDNTASVASPGLHWTLVPRDWLYNYSGHRQVSLCIFLHKADRCPTWFLDLLLDFNMSITALPEQTRAYMSTCVSTRVQLCTSTVALEAEHRGQFQVVHKDSTLTRWATFRIPEIVLNHMRYPLPALSAHP